MFNSLRLEEDKEYAMTAENKRVLTSACLTNCGSFLISGYSDGWLLKNYLENGKIVKKFKYTDNVIRFDESQRVLELFTDMQNSFIILIQDKKIVKLDFFSGMVLAEFKLTDFQKDSQVQLSNSFIDVDQQNNFIIIATDTNQMMIINWLNMTVVRCFSLERQKKISCIAIAKNAKKIIIASENKLLGVYDIFSSQLLSLFQLDGVIVSMDIREKVWTLAGSYVGQQSVNLWKIDNLDWKINGLVEMPFESRLRELDGGKRERYFGKQSEQVQFSRHQGSSIMLIWVFVF